MFCQVIRFRTDQIDDVQAAADAWAAKTEGRRTLRQSSLYRDREHGNAYLIVALFDDYASAMINSGLPETQALVLRMSALVTGLEYTDYDLLLST